MPDGIITPITASMAPIIMSRAPHVLNFDSFLSHAAEGATIRTMAAAAFIHMIVPAPNVMAPATNITHQ